MKIRPEELPVHRIKLMKPERRRVRVDELAKRLSVTSDELLTVLRDELHEFVPHAQSYIEEPIFRRVINRYGQQQLGIEEVHQTPAEKWREFSRPPACDPELAPCPPANNEKRFAPPPKLRRRNNNPYIRSPSELGRDTKATAPSQSASVPPSRQSDWDSGVSETMAPWSWTLYDFSVVERDCWMASGLRQDQAKVARDTRDAGLVPDDLGRDLDGWTVLERITHGEGAKAVARLMREAEGIA
ncbi:MAG TPA: hypothetical protein VGK53_11155 [Propionicimonas sp.]